MNSWIRNQWEAAPYDRAFAQSLLVGEYEGIRIIEDPSVAAPELRCGDDVVRLTDETAFAPREDER